MKTEASEEIGEIDGSLTKDLGSKYVQSCGIEENLQDKTYIEKPSVKREEENAVDMPDLEIKINPFKSEKEIPEKKESIINEFPGDDTKSSSELNGKNLENNSGKIEMEKEKIEVIKMQLKEEKSVKDESDNSMKEKKVKMIKKKKKKSPANDESTEIPFDELLTPIPENSTKNEDSYIIEEPNSISAEKEKLKVDNSPEILEDKIERIKLLQASKKASEDVSPSPVNDSKCKENAREDVILKLPPTIEKPDDVKVNLEEVKLKSILSKPEFKQEVYEKTYKAC